MSWDIFVQDFPRNAKTLEDLPEGFVPASIGKRSAVIAGIKEVVPSADFTDPSWGVIDGDGWSIEVNIGDSEACHHFAFHVRGGDAAAGVVAAILEHLGLRAVDSQSGDFFVAGPEAIESLRKWRAYRDQIVAGQEPRDANDRSNARSDSEAGLGQKILAVVSRLPWNRPKK
jgi:hypothetical protein